MAWRVSREKKKSKKMSKKRREGGRKDKKTCKQETNNDSVHASVSGGRVVQLAELRVPDALDGLRAQHVLFEIRAVPHIMITNRKHEKRRRSMRKEREERREEQQREQVSRDEEKRNTHEEEEEKERNKSAHVRKMKKNPIKTPEISTGRLRRRTAQPTIRSRPTEGGKREKERKENRKNESPDKHSQHVPHLVLRRKL